MATSWIIRNKATGEVLFETFNSKLVAALNTRKYEAMPIGQYLASLNQLPTAATVAQCEAIARRKAGVVS